MTSDDATGGPFDVDAVAAALRWVVGRAPRQADEAADRGLLRDLATALAPTPDGLSGASPRALDARLDAVLAELAASGEIADHCAPRHRGWVADVARIYFGDPDDLPDDLRARIGSETIVAHVHDGVTNRARAAALALDVDPNLVRVRREPLLLEATAAALVARVARPRAPAPRSTGDPSSSVRAGFAVDSTTPNRQRIAVGESLSNPHRTAPDLGPPRRGGRVLAAVALVALVAAAATAAIQAGADDEEPTLARHAGAVATAPALATAIVALGIDRRGALVAVTDDAVVPLGLDGVVTADAARDGERVHVVAERRDGHLVHATVGPEAGPWVDLGVGRTATVGATTEDTSVVVAVRGHDGELAHRSIGRDGEPTGEWARLSATGVVDVDMTANLDGRLEVGGVTERGTAFNVWQSEPPDGAVVRQQVPVPQADGTTSLVWPPSTVVTRLDPLGGPTPEALTVIDGEAGARVVASGAGRTVGLLVGPDGPGQPEPIAEVAVAELVAIDG